MCRERERESWHFADVFNYMTRKASKNCHWTGELWHLILVGIWVGAIWYTRRLISISSTIVEESSTLDIAIWMRAATFISIYDTPMIGLVTFIRMSLFKTTIPDKTIHMIMVTRIFHVTKFLIKWRCAFNIVALVYCSRSCVGSSFASYSLNGGVRHRQHKK